MSSGQQASRTQGAGPVVICCAAADAGAIATVARELQAEGHTVEVVSGVESDPKRLAAVIDRCRGEGLYVLCRSQALSRDAVDELRDVLLARHVPFGRTLTVASTRPRELRERIVSSLSRVAAGVVRKMANVPPEGMRADPPPRVRRTTQLGIPAPVVQPRPEVRAEPAPAAKPRRNSTQLGIPVADVARLAKEMSASPEADTRVENLEDEEPTNTRMRAPRTPIAAAAREAIEAAGRAQQDEPPTEPLAKAMSPQDVASQMPETASLPFAPEGPDPETDTLEFTKQQIEQQPEIKPPPPKAPPPPPPPRKVVVAPAPRPAPPTEDSVGRASVITAEELADLGGTDPKIRLGPQRPEDDFDSIPIRSGDTKVQTLAEAGLDVRSGNTAVVHVDDIVRSGTTMRVPAVPPTDPPSNRTEIAAAPPPVVVAGKGKSSIMLPAALAGGALLLGIVVAIAVTSGDDDASDDDDDEASEVAKADGSKVVSDGKTSGGEGSKSGGDTEAPSELAVGAARTKVGEALRSREVQALDVLLVTTKSFGPFEYAAAQSHCEGLSIGGLDGWRLPNIGELMSLAAAGMTGAGYYWSSTPADTFGDSRLVWYGKRARVLERKLPNFVACVRGTVE